MSSIKKMLSAFLLAVVLPLTGGPVAVAVSPVPATIKLQSEAITLATWVPWDWSKITTAANCASRRSYLMKTFGVQSVNMRCEMFLYPQCPPKPYWMVMVNASAAFGFADVAKASKAVSVNSISAAASC